MLIDTHCHLASHRFSSEEIPEILNRARAAGVARIVTLATSLDDLGANLGFTKAPEVHACIGIHPCDVHRAPDDAVAQLAEFAAHPGVCGIGETGLDYFHPAPDGWEDDAFRLRQREFLRLHFELAATSGLNVVIHTRDRQGHASLDDALTIYQEYHRAVRAVFHCFISGWDQAERVLALGGLLSFGGVTTFKNAREVRETALRCPAGSFMLETDSPYLAPEPHRGQRNEPAFVSHTADFIAALRQESRSDLDQHTAATAARFFRFRSDSI
jgi:TatD DNase family protein